MEFGTYKKFPGKVVVGWSSLKTQIPLTPSRYFLLKTIKLALKSVFMYQKLGS